MTRRRVDTRPQTAMIDASGPQAGQSTRTRKLLIWVISTVTASVLGAVVTLNVDAIKEWRSEQMPLESHVTLSRGEPWFWLVVPDPSRLPPGWGQVEDCDHLWTIGVAAGGILSGAGEFGSGNPAHRVLLRGVASTGVVITDMRARITKRAPALDGVLLTCPPQGAAEPIGLSFDLTKSDSAPAQRYDTGSDKAVNQFADGFAISVAENESLPLIVNTALPNDSIEWHIEADVLVGGDRRTIVIDNEGKDFFSPGTRPVNQYHEGYVPPPYATHWGVDKTVERGKGSNGADTLRLGPVIIPHVPGLDIEVAREDQALAERLLGSVQVSP